MTDAADPSSAADDPQGAVEDRPPALPSPALLRLAAAHGIGTDYWDWQGRHVPVTAQSLRAVLRALDVPAGTDEEVTASLAEAEVAPWRRTLPPTVVCREGWTPRVFVHVPHGTGVTLTVELEDGSTREARQVDRWVPPRPVGGPLVGEATFELPGDLPTGWHTLHAATDVPAPDPATTTATLVVTPRRLDLPGPLAAGRLTGLMTQLYQVRSADSWGVGDLGDLRTLSAWAAEELGAEFVLVNPLHAAEPVQPMEPSPYLPTTRRFANPIYLRVGDVPELAAADARTRAEVARLAAEAAALNDAPTIDRDAAWSLKRRALELAHGVPLDPEREAAYTAYRSRQGEGLVRFATWCALADRHGLPWQEWPAELRDPESAAVVSFREAEADLVDLHSWLQWLLEDQRGAVHHAVKAAGMELGVVHDLAVGVSPRGADAWGLPHALARGVTVGAPPDQFNQLGQDWSQPPWRPDRLAELGYAPFRDMVRSALRDSGGLRVDHVIGLFRLWWVPAGMSPAGGAYVHYDHEALLGILVLEAERAGAVVIGEDLGVVQPEARDYLLERGVLGTSILWFESEDGRPLPPEQYRRLCLASVTTHDLPPTAGYLELEHVSIRERLGLLTRPVAEERAAELESIDGVRQALVRRGLLDPRAGPESMTVALHAWLSLTPSRMLGMALADLVGDRRAVNQPGTEDEYPNWRVPLAGADGRPLSLERAMGEDLAPRIAEALRGRTGREGREG
ncbi:MAG TPA: 4-alpha-glucanotransferase [Dermatophilaceae bacterium]|nr:4-alpha-glucanotransferase [Dermatophilaceae bacterium]